MGGPLSDAALSVDALDAGGGDDRLRRAIGLALAPLVFAGLWLAPLELSAPAHRLAAILGTVVVLWVTEAIPMVVTALLGVAAAVALGVAPAKEAFAAFADPLVFVFVGTFITARAIFFHGLDRRFAYGILALPFVEARPRRVLAAYVATGVLISMWISNTATVAMLYPIGLSLLTVLESRGATGPRYASALLLGASFAVAIGGLATPVGTPPNMIGLGFLRNEIAYDLPFFSWMALGVPVSAVLAVACVLLLGRTAPAGGRVEALAHAIAAERRALGPWTLGQVNALIAFAVTVLLWVAPGFMALAWGTQDPLYKAFTTYVPEPVAALIGASLLFVLPVDVRRLEFTLPWEEAVRIDWWIVFLYGGGLALGTMAFQTGLAEAMGRALVGLLGVHGELGLLAFSTAMATVLSETTSNTAAANMIVPIAIALAEAAGTDPVLPVLGASLGSSLGFMLPVSTPCNAIVYASGRIPLRDMMRRGIVMDVVGVVLIVATLAVLGPLVLEPR
ncbi:MAG: DASS family sodium-coupled anion symporter [bacterium]|nr:DASS family sodium-coupled anion symporter [bacterium]